MMDNLDIKPSVEIDDADLRTPRSKNGSSRSRQRNGTRRTIQSGIDENRSTEDSFSHAHTLPGPTSKIGYNPQDATMLYPAVSHESDMTLPTRNGAAVSSSPKRNNRRNAKKQKQRKKPDPNKWKRRKRGRYSRVAAFEEPVGETIESKSSSFPALPDDQYRAVLRRRAIRKLEDIDGEIAPPIVHNPINDHDDEDADQIVDEVYGDTSLGMKLIVVGGKVIVQLLNSLSDGRASPAQLIGVIQRGDVLLSINNFSIVDLPIDQLMDGLKPLSAPDSNGAYHRTLTLRFESEVGIDLLIGHEQGQLNGEKGKRISGVDPANDMFSLFPMVDQLSGAPLFEFDENEEQQQQKPPLPEPEKHDHETALPRKESSQSESNNKAETGDSTDYVLSESLAVLRQFDRKLFTSKFFAWNDEAWEWLRSQGGETMAEPVVSKSLMTQAERIEKGHRVLQFFKKMSFNIEETDKGKDMRSFKLWNSSLSLQSGASRRRRVVFDAVSLPAHRFHERFGGETIVESDEDDDSLGSGGSGGSGSGDEVDGDELLLGLAAHDEIWRKQVLETLDKAIDDMKNGKESVSDDEPAEEATTNIDSAISNELGAFLFGENISRVIKKKKSHALPPDEVTSVLFDLTTNIATSAPDEISISGQQSFSHSLQSSMGYHGMSSAQRRGTPNAEVVLATQFILNHSLPLWLQSFRPLPWEQRRVLWPRVKTTGGGSNMGGTIFSDDSLTVDSNETGRSATYKNRNLQEIIEDQELDIEARAETCFLVTFFFTQKFLPACTQNIGNVENLEIDENIRQAVSFIQQFGAYLEMHTSMTYAASIRAEPIIEELLRLAAHDIGHKDASKELSKANSLMFYNSAKLSAVVKALASLRYELSQEKRRVLVHLSVSAYPDIQPWQLKVACRMEELEDDCNNKIDEEGLEKTPKKMCSKESLGELYYSYLVQLLDPVDGHSHARRDVDLVNEFCELSVGKVGEPVDQANLLNFFNVASRSSSSHLAYMRDLVSLLDISMRIGEKDLVLDLANEIIESRSPKLKDERVLDHVLCTLRELALGAVDRGKAPEYRDQCFRLLARTLRLYQNMDAIKLNDSADNVRIIEVPRELYRILGLWQDDLPPQKDTCHPRMMVLMDFLVKEVGPDYILRMLAVWSESYGMGSSLFGILHSLLQSGSKSSLEQELSGSLLRLKHERSRLKAMNAGESPTVQEPINTNGQLWKLMSAGGLTIDK